MKVQIINNTSKVVVDNSDVGLSVIAPSLKLVTTQSQGPPGPPGPMGYPPIEDGVINYNVDGDIVSIQTTSKTTTFLRNSNNEIIGADYGSYSKMFLRDSNNTIVGWEIVYG